MIFAADLTSQSFLVFSKPFLYFAVTVPDVDDMSSFVILIPPTHVLALILASFLSIFKRHDLIIRRMGFMK